MARRGFSTLLIGLAMVLNGTVMLLGPGLHGLTGCGHPMFADQAVRSPDDGLQVAPRSDDGASSCPVCEYLAQGQMVAERVVFGSPGELPPSVAVLSPISGDIRPQRTPDCRAPPADSHR
jgi:hypothetical protein